MVVAGIDNDCLVRQRRSDDLHAPQLSHSIGADLPDVVIRATIRSWSLVSRRTSCCADARGLVDVLHRAARIGEATTSRAPFDPHRRSTTMRNDTHLSGCRSILRGLLLLKLERDVSTVAPYCDTVVRRFRECHRLKNQKLLRANGADS